MGVLFGAVSFKGARPNLTGTEPNLTLTLT
jgi:hypothetical protein